MGCVQKALLADLGTRDDATVVSRLEPTTMDTSSELPEVFRWLPGWLEPAEAGRLLELLLAEIPWEDHVVTIVGRQVPVPRRVAFYGPFPYTYSGIVHPARPPPAVVAKLRDRIESVSGHPFNSVLMNLYRSGSDSVSWHSDDDYPHGGHPAVASLSLGETRRFRIAHKRRADERYAIDLTAGGLLLMDGTSQLDYRHALPKSAKATGVRINLTFRHMTAPNV
jgi:alkylated DNA repair dioxygenase AlkB